jgi:hypothetical protein
LRAFQFAWLVGITGDPLSPTYYVIQTSAVSLWAMFQLPETFRTQFPARSIASEGLELT